jgi:hypothetical protein
MQPLHDLSRRQVLVTYGGLAFGGLSGCVELFGQSKPVFTDASVDGEYLVVDLTEDPQASVINLFDPKDNLRGRKRIRAGMKTVKFFLYESHIRATPYPPGTYRIVAGKKGKVMQESTIELSKSEIPD